MKNFIIDFLQFYKNPSDTRIEHYSLSKNIRYIIYGLIIDLILLVFFIPLGDYFADTYLLDSSLLVYKEDTLLFLLVIGVLVLPLFEELLFRLPIRYNRFYSFFLSKKIWSYLFRVIVYCVPLIFGLVHLDNFNLNGKTTTILIFVPLVVLSQIIGGYIITFIRVKFNFLSSVIYHMIWNLTVTIGGFIFTSFEKPYVVTNNDYSIEITANSYTEISKQNLSVDSSDNKIYRIEAQQLSINHVLDSLTAFKRNKEDRSVNILFQSQNGMSKKQFLKIIEDYDKNCL
ncbi:CPBP family intramembrane glutamic endopeptidase [Chryseobacterium culicis]|uniref:CAAX protease self-immunity n=1 Tax=Chryseobacterium culicis TaxID=680127 RepID=A0A1H6IRX8_CHRCI|nr:CPBP family intramembrane glutamic endopeptidase [Chryseobacterium culicis]SEH49146.1 CAAX protease self-immunity [Chryseobacterium culicis]